MDRGPLILICLACSCFLIFEGESAALTEACTEDSSCTMSILNSVCNNGACACDSNFFVPSTNDSCEIKKILGESCPTDGPVTKPCSDPLANCEGGACLCPSTHYDNNGNLTSGGVCTLKKDLGDSCPTGGQVTNACSDPVAICVNGKCVCTSTYYDDNGVGTNGGECTLKKDLGDSCPIGGLVTDACSDPVASCVNGNCVCPSTYYDDNGVGTNGGACILKKVLGDSCPTGGQATDACSDPVATCVNGKCVCPSTYYDDNGVGTNGGACILKKDLGDSCPTGGQVTNACSDSVATCVNGNCVCPSTYYDDNGVGTNGGACTLKKDLGDSCPTGGQVTNACSDPVATCVNGNCVCLSTYYDDNGVGTNGGACILKKVLGDSCPTGVQVTNACSDPVATCVNGNCVCPSTYYDDNGVGTNGGACTLKKVLGDSCPTDGQVTNACSDPVANCVGGKCVCPGSYYDNNGGTSSGVCTLKKVLGENCNELATCLDSNAECFMGTCVCPSTHYDDNGAGTSGGACTHKKVLGDSCPTDGQVTNACSDPVANCIGGKCVCPSTHYDNNGGTIRGTCTLKKVLGDNCPTSGLVTNACSDLVANCVGGTCVCPGTHYDDDGVGTSGGACTPKVNLGDTCPMSDACITQHAYCQGTVCACEDAFYDDNGGTPGGNCLSKFSLNQRCTYSSVFTNQCSDIKAQCQYDNGYQYYRCVCIVGYSESQGNCKADQALGGPCETMYAGKCSDTRADCTNNICICNAASYDDNGLLKGGNCRDLSQLRVSGLIINNPLTNGFTVQWTAPSNTLVHVSGYTVQWWLKDNTVGGGNADVGNATSYIVNSRIEAGKAYRVKVISRNDITQEGSQRTVESVIVEQASKPSTPGRLLDSSNFDAADKRINLYWTTSAGVASAYTVKLLEGTEELESSTFTSAQGILNNEFILNGHRYNISVTALSESFGTGNAKVDSEAYIEEIKTVVKEPGPPRSVDCVNALEETIRLTWIQPALPNGDIIQYHITVKRRDFSIYSRTVSSTNTMDVGGLEPGSYYSFEVTTENEMYTSSLSGSTSGICTTQARTSDAPSELLITDVTSRSIEFEWKYPANTYSEELLGYVIQVRDESNECDVEIIYQCSDCFKTVTVSELQNLCNNQDITTTSRSASELNGKQVYTVSGLLPDIQYTLIVTGVNLAGRGHNATTIQKTTEEVPAKPEIDNLRGKTPTSFIITWKIEGPRPGTTNYTIIVSADDPPAPSINITVHGFEMRSKEVEGLEENWRYTVSISASTSVGSRTSVSQPIRTDPSAPGQVSAFNVDKTPDGNHDEWRVTWKIPPILERNSNITSYKIIHNGTTTQPEKEILAEIESYTYEATLGVTSGTYYSVEVFAINEQDQEGVRVYFTGEALAKVPVLPDPEFKVIQQDSIQINKNTIKITVDRGFVNLNTAGSLRHTGIICLNHAKLDQFEVHSFLNKEISTFMHGSIICCPGWGVNHFDVNMKLLITTMENHYAIMTVDEFNGMEGWYTASKNGFSPYRVTKTEWVKNVDCQSSGRKKRATDAITFIIGGETCNDASQTYCNGPLQEDTQYSVVVVICTNGGCLVSPLSGPYRTLAEVAESGDKATAVVVVGVVLGIVIVLLIAVVVFLMFRYVMPARAGKLRRKSENDVCLSDRQNIQPTYESSIASGPEQTVYMDLNDDSRDDKSTYDSLALEKSDRFDRTSMNRQQAQHTYQNA